MQRKALEAGPGPVLVLAGPGAGKTRTLVGRLVRLLRSGTPASDIVAITFTRRAAEEMRSRLAAAMDGEENAPLPEADTLHALGPQALARRGSGGALRRRRAQGLCLGQSHARQEGRLAPLRSA